MTPSQPSLIDRLRDPSERTLGFMLLAPAFLLSVPPFFSLWKAFAKK